MQPVEPQKEHQWLHRLVGEWTFENECIMEPGKPPMKVSGTEVVRSFGGIWVSATARARCPAACRNRRDAADLPKRRQQLHRVGDGKSVGLTAPSPATCSRSVRRRVSQPRVAPRSIRHHRDRRRRSSHLSVGSSWTANGFLHDGAIGERNRVRRIQEIGRRISPSHRSRNRRSLSWSPIRAFAYAAALPR